MTCLEKWKLEHGDKVESDLHPALDEMCPSDFKYLKDPACCDMTCGQCWDREIEEANADVSNLFTMPEIPTGVVDKFNAIPLINTVRSEDISDEPKILDSGDRTHFESGAVRDMREGKGRCDLMPLEVVAYYICDGKGSSDTILLDMKEFLQTNNTVYLYSALNTFDVMVWDCAYTMMLETSKHYEEGAKKYGPDNWRHGIPTWCYIDSAIRHYLKWRRGDKDEPHDRAFVWNLLCCIWEVDYGEEWRKAKDVN